MPLLEADFYSLCESHGHKNTFFCLDCIGSILCQGCLKANIHPHHPHIIQNCFGLVCVNLLRCTNPLIKVAIKYDSLYKVMDVSHIQPYKNNDSRVVFVNQKEHNSNAIGVGATILKPPCETCGCLLLPLTTSKFCSIECKLNYGEGDFRKQITNKIGISNQQQQQQPQENSYGKRGRRKGNPRRSPFVQNFFHS